MPGSDGWEVWKGSGEALSLHKASGQREALAVDGVPNGQLVMAFPIRDVSAAPFVAATGDEGMFRDLADLHLERSGLRSGEAAGSLSDCFTLRTTAEEAVLLPVVLSPPPEGGLPKKSPKGFDVSARCLPLPASSVILWREFGRWVFTVSDAAGQVVYFQALPGALFDAQLAREVALGVAQLSMQDVLGEPVQQCVIWTGEGEIPAADEGISTLSEVLKVPHKAERKPAPRIPAKLSRLLPADIRAERVAQQKAKQMQLGIAAGVIAYLGAIGFMAWKYMGAQEEAEIAEAKAIATEPMAAEVTTFTGKWSELQPLVENDYWPVEQYFQAYQAAPKQGLRIQRAEMRNEFQVQDGSGQVIKRAIILIGESDEAEQAVQFGENLGKSDYFANFSWNIPSPTPTKTDSWRFEYAATPSTEVL